MWAELRSKNVQNLCCPPVPDCELAKEPIIKMCNTMHLVFLHNNVNVEKLYTVTENRLEMF